MRICCAGIAVYDMRRASSDKALADSFGGSFSAGGGIEFGEDVGDVGLGGAGADVEAVADLCIRQPATRASTSRSLEVSRR